jgi:hypothetical protein
MRAWCVAALVTSVMACEKASPSSSSRQVVIHFVGQRVGNRGVTHEDFTSTFTFEDAGADGKPVEVKTTRHKVADHEVLDVSGRRATRERVTYRELSSTREARGTARDDAPPIAGKTYIVARENDAVVVYEEDGKTAPPAAERDGVAKDSRALGTPSTDAVERFLAGSTLEVGKSVELSSDALEQLNSAYGDQHIDTLTLVLRDTAGGVASFDISVTLSWTGNGPGGGLHAKLAGTMNLSIATARTVFADMHGPVTGSAQGHAYTGEMHQHWALDESAP